MIGTTMKEFLRRRLASGVRWLYRSEQSKDGVLTHHGIYLNLKDVESPGYESVRVIPSAHGFARESRDGGYPIIVVDMPSNLQRFSKQEEKELRSLIEEIVRPYTKIIDSWNGVGCPTVSYQLQRRASRQVLNLVENCQQGCPIPEHGILCDWDGCTWYPDGYKEVNLPRGWR